MAATATPRGPVAGSASPPPRPKPVGDSPRHWKLSHKIAYGLTWSAGIFVVIVAVAIVGYMGYQGLHYLRPDLLFTRPTAGLAQSEIGGILDPVIGTVLLTLLGVLFAVPLGVVAAVWVVEFGQPARLARAIESAIEVVAGIPDIVIAIFGLAIFQLPIFGFLSFTQQGGGVFGRSFIAAGLMMSLIALPPVFAATREGLAMLPARLREGSWALGKTKICTVRTVLLPQVRPNIATGTILGMGRIIGDTAVVVVLLGATLRISPQGGFPGLNILRGTGSTLTSFVYSASPAGEGNAPQKAYAAAFVLLIIVLGLNALTDVIGRRTGSEISP